MALKHPRIVATLVALPFVLLLALVAFVQLALPGLARTQASRYVLEKTGHHLDFDPPEVHLFGPQLHLAHLRLTEPDGKPLLSFASLDVSLAGLPLLRGDVHVTGLTLAAPRATLAVRPDGRLNWSLLIERLQAAQGPARPAPADGKPSPVEIDTLSVTAAEIDAADERIGFSARTTPLDLSLAHLSTTGDTGGHYKLSATTSVGARIVVEGEVLLKDFHTQGALQVEGLQLAGLAPLIDAKAPVRVPAGVAGLQTRYDVSWKGAQAGAVLDGLALSVHDLRVRQARPDSPTLAVGAVTLDGGHFDLVPRQLRVEHLKVEHAGVSLPQGAGAPVEVTLGGLAVEQASADLAAHQAHVALVQLADGQLQAARGKDGRIDLLEALQAVQGAPAAAGNPAPVAAAAGKDRAGAERPAASAGSAGPAPAEDARWHFGVDRVALSGFRARFHDASVQPAAEFDVAPIDAEVEGISDDLAKALKLRASFKVASGGSFEAHGQWVPATAAADLQFRLAGLALKPAQPYVGQFAHLDIAGGEFSLGGQVRTGGSGGPSVQGDFGLQKLRLDEAGTHNLFLGLNSLATRKFSATPKRLDIPQLTLAGLDTQLLIAKDKSVNLSRILVGQGKAGGAPAAPAAAAHGAAGTAAAKAAASTSAATTPPAAPAAATRDPGAFQANIDQLRVIDSALDYADLSLALPFGTRIHHLHGVLNGLSTRKDARGQLLLDGQVDDYGSAHAEGRLDLFNPTGYMDIKVVFRNVEMTRLTPYSATFAGRRISSGKLSLDLEYKINHRQLDGDNRVVMDQLTLGERVDSPGATSLPLDLAIAILSDSDGHIDLGLPVSGSLDDPQFSYGRIIWKAIVNVIGKIVLSPFRALGSLFGGSGEKFESVAFAPGSAALSPPEREKLGKIAAALAKRPGIALAAPAAFSDADRPALQDLLVRRAIAARAGQAVGPEEDPGPVAVRSPDVQAAIEGEFAARLGAEALGPLRKSAQQAGGGTLPDGYYEDLIRRMSTAQAVTDEDLQALGRQRATAVTAGLQAAGVAETRLTAGDPAKVDLQDAMVPVKLAPGTAKPSS